MMLMLRQGDWKRPPLEARQAVRADHKEGGVMTEYEPDEQSLNKAMLEAVEFVHAEGWDQPPTLFGLVPTDLISSVLGEEEDSSPLTLVVQELPQNLLAGSPELVEYVSRAIWPEDIAGVILAQEIRFRDISSTSDDARPARLFSGVLKNGPAVTLLQNRPTEEELEEQGIFAQDNIDLRGGPSVAPGVISALRYSLESE